MTSVILFGTLGTVNDWWSKSPIIATARDELILVCTLKLIFSVIIPLVPSNIG